MTWKTTSKSLDISATVAHSNFEPNVLGRAPGISSLRFSPLELYGAAARCSHLNSINPAIVTAESLMIEAMLAQHIDDSSADFAILSTADNLKDFVRSYFAGTVAAGTAYLAMINDGYVWFDHFERAGGGSPSVPKSPDFVFSGPSTGVALVETKGSRSGTLAKFDNTVRDGYLKQVDPHLGYPVGGVPATHGFCIGSYLRSHTKAEMRIHHTKSPSTGIGSLSTGEDTNNAALGSLQRHSYASAFAMLYTSYLGDRLRTGDERDVPIIFYRFEWLGRRWLTRFGLSDHHPFFKFYYRYYDLDMRTDSFSFFAIEENIASTVLARFLGRSKVDAFERSLEPLPRELIVKARHAERNQAGAIFPDGLALIGHRPELDGRNWMQWDERQSCFVPLNR